MIPSLPARYIRTWSGRQSTGTSTGDRTLAPEPQRAYNLGLHIYATVDTLLCVRTTLVIDDGLFRQIKKKAAEQGRTLQAVVNDLLRRALVQTARGPYRLNLKGWQANEQPGVDLLDRDKLFDLMDGR